MHTLLPFLIAGLVSGSIYGLAGVGLVVTYKTSGVFNFAHGALASVAAFVFYVAHVEHHVAWPVAAAIAVFLAGPALALLLERLARAVTEAPLTIRVVSTIGVLLVIEATIVLIFGTVNVRVVRHFLPQSGFHLDGTLVTAQSLIIFAIALAASLGLAVFFKASRAGVAMRAVVDAPDLLDIAGTSPTVVRRGAWMIGVTFAAASGVLLSPLYPLDATTLTLLVVQAFGAAALGAFSNLPLTYAGGLLIGVGAALCSKYFTSGALSGLSSSLPFLVLFLVLLAFPKRWLRGQEGGLVRVHSSWRAPRPVQFAGGAAVVVLLLAVPSFAGLHLADWAQFLSYTILLLSLGLLVRNSGQVSLCHVSFLAIGATAFGHLTEGEGVPWLLALLIAGMIAVPVGALLAIPAIRLSGLYLALATFGFGILLQYMFYSEHWMFGSTGAGQTVPRPRLPWLNLTSDRAYYYLLLVIAALVVVFVVVLNRSRLGRLLIGLGDSPATLATSGASVQVTQVVVFCLSAFLAAIAGALGGGAVGVVSSSSYAPLTSLLLFAVVIITAGGEPWYALFGAAGLTLIPSYLTSPKVATYLELAFGAAALLYSLTPAERRGVPAIIRQRLDTRLSRRSSLATSQGVPAPAASPAVGTVPVETPAAAAQPTSSSATLEVKEIRVKFGGLVAVDGMSLQAPAGRITGLIGPNGAGKTTVFNVCSGLLPPASGDVTYAGRSMRRMSTAARARLGVGRTFQQVKLFESLDVFHNVALGVEARLAGANPARHLLGAKADNEKVRASVHAALEVCGILALCDSLVRELSTGQRRMVELARCLAGDYDTLLLDEPSSGLDASETSGFGAVLQQAVQQRGVGILLVEHDMTLINDICDYVYVLDFGRQIFEGRPSDLAASAVVRSAYLGGADLDIGASSEEEGVAL